MLRSRVEGTPPHFRWGPWTLWECERGKHRVFDNWRCCSLHQRIRRFPSAGSFLNINHAVDNTLGLFFLDFSPMAINPVAFLPDASRQPGEVIVLSLVLTFFPSYPPCPMITTWYTHPWEFPGRFGSSGLWVLRFKFDFFCRTVAQGSFHAIMTFLSCDVSVDVVATVRNCKLLRPVESCSGAWLAMSHLP